MCASRQCWVPGRSIQDVLWRALLVDDEQRRGGGGETIIQPVV